ncbi:MAG: hypothetical protein HRU19_13010 [Pseudobacteriovorax sp.]|nr:hypothetical protein [Pseudobacteriovorax sp.]
MNKKKLGYFKELPYGTEGNPSIEEAKGKLAKKDITRVLEYLRNGELEAVAPELAKDYFDDSKIIGPLSQLTDGTWIWMSDLPYYVENYRVELPEDFIESVTVLADHE